MKKVLVTGSSRGIGKAIALRLARDGYKVIVHCASNTEKAKNVCDEIISAGGQAEYIIANLCDREQVDMLCSKIGDVDALVLNASLQIRKPWQEIPYWEIDDQLGCNFIASVKLIPICSFIPHLKLHRPIWCNPCLCSLQVTELPSITSHPV